MANSRKPSQADRILNHLYAHGSITVTEAEAFPIFSKRLAARIKDLQNRGIRIEREMFRVPSGKLVARYHLHSVDKGPTLEEEVKPARQHLAEAR